MANRTARFLIRLAAAGALMALVAGCQVDELGYGPKAQRPVSQELQKKMADLDMDRNSPIMIRIIKEDSQLEVWKQTRSGKYALLHTFEICKWSGDLGPKKKEGDRQAPEGFYEITPALMNPNSNYYLSFNIGYPNKFDRSYGRTGTNLMVHGACSSRGCYAMTDPQIQDIFALARDAFKGGQRAFQVEALPFRLTPENMAKHRDNENMPFWQMLKVGYDHFEVTREPPKVDVCDRKYVFDAAPLVAGIPFAAAAKCPAFEVDPKIQAAVSAKEAKDQETYTKEVNRLEAKAARDARWADFNKKVANVIGGNAANPETTPQQTEISAIDKVAPANTTTTTTASSGSPVPTANPQRETVTAKAETSEQSGGIFSSLFRSKKSSGADDTTQTAGDQSVPEAKASPVANAYTETKSASSGGFLRRFLPASGESTKKDEDQPTAVGKAVSTGTGTTSDQN